MCFARVIPIKVNTDRYNRSHPDNDNILPGVFGCPGMVAGDGILCWHVFMVTDDLFHSRSIS